MLAEAAITSRNSFSASGVPTAAILPMSQMAVRCVSRSVVTTSSLRPLAFSRATCARISARHQLAQPRIAEQAGTEQHTHDAGIIQQTFCDAAGEDLLQR